MRRTALVLIATVMVVAFVVAYRDHLAAAAIAVPLLVSLGGWWWTSRRGPVSAPPEVAAAADRLAQVMTARWRREATGRRIVTPAPATVRWRWATDEVMAPRPEVTMSPAPGTGPSPLPDLEAPGELLGSGVVTRLHDEVYARLPHGRLVLLGGPGAGKTGAMILLLLAALHRRTALADDRRARVPVPVWLTLGGWNSATTPLLEWALSTMNRDHPALRAPDYGPDAAGELLRGGRVALFLDGLDEMPEGARARALKRLSEEARGLRTVITSRPEEYRHALQASRPDNTAVIELRPVRPVAAAAYLLHGQTGPNRQRWEQVGAYLTQHPDSVAARALDNPLTLSLARDAYASQDPATLTDPGSFPTVEAIREHLIDQIVITAYPDEHQRTHATRWLAWISHHMDTSRDLAWWDIPTWISRWQLRLTRGLVAGLVAGLAYGLGAGIRFGFEAGVAAGLVAGLLVWLTRPPHTLVPRWPRPRELGLMLAFGLAAGLAGGLVYGLAGRAGLVFGLGGGLTARLTAGFAAGLAVALAVGLVYLWQTPLADSPSATAVGTYRADRRTSLIAGLGVGFVAGLAVGLGAGLGTGLGVGLLAGLAAGIAVGFLAGLAGGRVPTMKLTELVLTCQGLGRVHFLHLLEDALDRQVLRQAGSVYQFRHAALQDHFAAMYRQPPTSSSHSARP
jgi:hypothetical protein